MKTRLSARTGAMTISVAALTASLLPALAAPASAAEDGAAVRGVIRTAEGAPVENALVETITPEGSYARSDLTDAQGRFVVDDVPTGRYRVSVSNVFLHSTVCLGALGQQGCGAAATTYTVGSADIDTGTTTLTLRKPRVDGVVRGVGDRPVAHAYVDSADSDVVLETDAPMVRRSRIGLVVPTDRSGRFHFVGEDPTAIDVYAPGYRTRTVAPRLGAPGSTTRQDVRLRATSSVRATVRTGHRKATLRLRVTSAVKGADRRGRVVVRWTKPNGKAGRTVVRVDAKGRATTHLPRVKAGKRTFTLRWLGNDDLVADRGRATKRVR